MKRLSINKFKNRKKLFSILIILFFLSRLLFINSDPVFFDSPEYLARLSNPKFIEALASGHLPLHVGYILFFWPIYQLGKVLGVNPATFVIVAQVILSFLAIYCFYQLIKHIFDKNISFISAIIFPLLPLFWITNVTIMMETTYVSFFIFSALFLTKYTSSKNPKFINLLLSVIFWGISFLNHTVAILWLPFIFYIAFYLNKNDLFKIILSFLIGLFVSSVINGYFISIINRTNLIEATIEVYTSKLNEGAQLNFNINSLLVYLRNFTIPLLRNYTILIVVLGFFSLLKLFFTNKRLFVLCLLWIAPSVIANQWWDSLFFGRHSLIAGLGLALLASLIISRGKAIIIVVIAYLLIVSLPVLFLLREEIPYLEISKTAQELTRNGLLVESHFARPQVDGSYSGKIIFIDEPGWKKERLESDIKQTLIKNKPVFITSQALSEPYGLYSGPYLHILSLSYKKESVLKKIVEKFTLKEYKIINRHDNLIIYQIVSSAPSEYPNISILKNHRRRIDFFDPLTQLWFVISEKFNPS